MKSPSLIRALPLFLLAAGWIPAQTTWHVSAAAPPPGTGSASSPFPTIQQGITAAGSGDTVLVGPGTYVENIDFAGQDITVRSSAGASATFIDGGAAFPCVFFVTGETQTSVLRGFTLFNGNFVDGGGAHCAFTSPRIENCVFTGNVAVNNGGGLFSLSGAPVVSDCVFTYNVSTLEGGGLTCAGGSTATILRCTFTGNNSNYGGAWSSNGSSPTFVDCVADGNTANNDGGGVQLFGGSPVLRRCDVRWNGGGFGGGIGISSTVSATIDRCTVVHNNGLASGGGISAGFATVQVTDSVIANNACIVFGAGIYATSSTFTVRHTTLRGNVAGIQGGGIHVFFGPDPAVTNAILWANAPDQASGQPGAAVQITRSDVQGGYPGAGNINADPLHASVAALDFRLLAASPCRDAGSAAGAAGIATDLEGNPRILGAAPDLGADEYAPSYPGTGEDLLLETWVAGEGASTAIKPAAGGQSLALRMTSPAGTFLGAVPIVAATFYPNAAPPAPIPGFPAIHIDLANFFLLVDGSAPPPFFVAALAPAGVGLGFTVPPGLAGFTLRIQGAAFTPLAANSAYATTDAHELRFN